MGPVRSLYFSDRLLDCSDRDHVQSARVIVDRSNWGGTTIPRHRYERAGRCMFCYRLFIGFVDIRIAFLAAPYGYSALNEGIAGRGVVTVGLPWHYARRKVVLERAAEKATNPSAIVQTHQSNEIARSVD